MSCKDEIVPCKRCRPAIFYLLCTLTLTHFNSLLTNNHYFILYKLYNIRSTIDKYPLGEGGRLHVFWQHIYQVLAATHTIRGCAYIRHVLSTRVYGLAQNVSTMNYCSTFEIVFVHFREDFKNLILELCFFTTKYTLYLILFLQVQSL